MIRLILNRLIDWDYPRSEYVGKDITRSLVAAYKAKALALRNPPTQDLTPLPTESNTQPASSYSFLPQPPADKAFRHVRAPTPLIDRH